MKKAAKSSALFRHAAPTLKKDDAMNKQTTRYELDLNNPPPLTPQQQAELEALKAMPEESIDYSDIGPLPDESWKNVVGNPLYKPMKTSTTVRLDADVLLWLKSKGKGYQTQINRILREAMLNELGR
jgi:uncharacterized protein (DUF4415 family)